MSKELIDAIAEQERRLVLERFDEETVFSLGCALRARALAQGAPVTIEIRAAARRLFFTTLPGATPENEDWGRRKINAVLRTFKSSMRAGLEADLRGRSQWPDLALPHAEFVLHGGGFPVTVKGVGVVAAIGISGLPSIEDHQISALTLAEHLGIAPIALP